MKIEVLGCYGNIIGDYRATAFIIITTANINSNIVRYVIDSLHGKD